MTGSDLTFHDAEDARKRQITLRTGRTFKSVRAAISWWVEARERMSAPKSPAPHTEPAPYARVGGHCRSDTRVLVQVEGGRGGDLDDVLATITTIGQAMAAADRDVRPGAGFLLRVCRDGVTFAKLAEERDVSSSTVSAEIGRAESYLLALLKSAGIVV